ncbi:hypothetical protein GGF39_002433 [Coemansia sp. RSA 1721]|nr:hypothetical protein GGF39_002433 [Coemansia sp. RSA 1721]
MVFDDPLKQQIKRPACDKDDAQVESKRRQTEKSVLEIVATRINTDAQAIGRCPNVICARTKALAKRVVACPGGSSGCLLVEHVSGQLSLVRPGARHSTTLAVSDVVYAWWIDQNTVGVVSKSCLESGMLLYALDCSSDDALSEHVCEPSRAIARLDCDDKQQQGEQVGSRKSLFSGSGPGISGPIVAGGDSIVFASSGGFLRVWRINRNVSGVCVSVTCDRICLDAVLGGDQERIVVDLRWTAEGVGLGATRTRAFWFVLPTSGSPASVVECQGYRSLLPGMASWRWDGSVIATTKTCRTLPPRDAMLCLPSPTGMSFYFLDRSGERPAMPVHTFAFPRGWVWLCGSDSVFVLLSPCRKKATVCRMPSGESIYTLNIGKNSNNDELIQDAWISDTESSGCVVSTGVAIYAIGWKA